MKNNLLYIGIIICIMSVFPSFADISQVTGADMLLKYEFISGNDGDLMVDKPITRAEVAVIMTELKGVKEEAKKYAAPSTFTDVNLDQWYSPYIAYGQLNGFLGGYPDGTFHPETPVSAQEFAAFIMNAMGYSGDYNYTNVLSFSMDKKVNVSMSNGTFLRGDAFEAMWQAVNQPVKGARVSLGVALGKLSSNLQIDASTMTDVSPVIEMVATSAKAFEIRFKSSVQSPEKMTFELKNQMNKILFRAVWNQNNTVVKLISSYNLTPDKYEVIVIDSSEGAAIQYGPFYAVTEKEKVTKVTFDSETIIRYSDYVGSVRYKAFNQYDEDITDTALGRALQFSTSTTVSKPTVDYSTGIITIQHGTAPQTKGTLKDLPTVNIIITDPNSGFMYNKVLNVSTSMNGVSQVTINGVVDEDGDIVDFVYSKTANYYLNITVVDTNGNLIKSKSILDTTAVGGQESLMVYSTNSSLVTVSKVNHPQRSSEIAFKINLISEPDNDVYVTFNAVAPYSTTANNSSILTVLLEANSN